jgi:hypothetical protein
LELAGETDRLDSELLIPPDWMVDEQRQPEIVSMWTNANEYMQSELRHSSRNGTIISAYLTGTDP